MAVLFGASPDAEVAYDATAPFYDALTGHPGYADWVRRLLDLARAHGAHGARLLDVACGTGASFLPLLRDGWSVTGCDISQRMLDIAAAKADAPVDLHRADMREIPPIGPFGLVWCLNDALNYLLEAGDVDAAIAAMAANLADDGVLLFDVNTALGHESFFGQTMAVETEDAFVIWRGLGREQRGDDSFATGVLDGFHRDDDGWTRVTARHEQRLHSDREIRASLARAGVVVAATAGARADGRLDPTLDPSVHIKVVYVARRRSAIAAGEEVNQC